MLVNLLVASGITLPYWIFQKATKKPVEPGKTYRLRVFTGVLGTLCALDLLIVGAITVAALQEGKNARFSSALYLPAVALASGLSTKKGWMREPFKKFEPTVES